jgi:acyl-CoA synthetase (AMP-forming)/AMP-acid ligase II
MSTPTGRAQTLADLPALHAARAPDGIALQFERRTTTWSQWERQANRIAHALLARGWAAGRRIGYLGKNSDRFFHVFFGAAKARMVTVPVNWRLTAPEIAFILDDAECPILFVGADYLPLLPALREACGRLGEVVCVDGPADGAVALDDWLARHDHDDAPPPGQPAREDDVVLQLYTSGTTGLPKGAQLTHRGLLFAAALGGTETLGRWREDDVSVLPLPLFHAGGLVYGLNGPYAGCTTVVVREANPALILAACREAPAPVTRLGVVPAVLQMLLNHPEFAPSELRSLRTLTYGGAPVPPAVLRQAVDALGPVLVQLFGMTETCTIGTALLPADHDPAAHPERLASCGRPLPGVELRVVDAQGGSAASGQSGEILIRCPAVMAGYWHRDEASAAALKDGWYHSGDVGYLDADGYLYIRDRLKDMIVSGGENVYPAEVERALAEHPAVADVAVFGVPDPRWGEAVKAAVVLRPGRQADADELIAFARGRIAGYKCPKSVDFMDGLPRNATGKLLKRVLREPYWNGQSRNVG